MNHGEYDVDPFNTLHAYSFKTNAGTPSSVNSNHVLCKLDGSTTTTTREPFPENEWRNFDTKDKQSVAECTTDQVDTNFTYFIQTQYPRSIERYSTEFDINGQRVIRSTGSNAPNTEADYSGGYRVENERCASESDLLRSWRIQRLALYIGKSHVIRLYAWQFSQQASAETGLLQLSVRRFIRRPKGSDSPRGDHWETENTYQLIIYHRGIGIRYDRVIGFKEFSSEDVY